MTTAPTVAEHSPSQPDGDGAGRPIDELTLYKADYPAWAKQAAPKRVRLMQQADDEELRWLCSITGNALKREVWALADDELKTRIKNITTKESA